MESIYIQEQEGSISAKVANHAHFLTMLIFFLILEKKKVLKKNRI